MNYLIWVIIAMIFYGITAVLLKAGLKNSNTEIALILTNIILVLGGIAIALFKGSLFTKWPSGLPLVFLSLAGITLIISIGSYYTALSKGPVSIVVPIFSMSFAIASILGIIFLSEEINAFKILGLFLAGTAIIMLTRERYPRIIKLIKTLRDHQAIFNFVHITPNLPSFFIQWVAKILPSANRRAVGKPNSKPSNSSTAEIIFLGLSL